MGRVRPTVPAIKAALSTKTQLFVHYGDPIGNDYLFIHIVLSPLETVRSSLKIKYSCYLFTRLRTFTYCDLQDGRTPLDLLPNERKHNFFYVPTKVFPFKILNTTIFSIARLNVNIDTC